MPFDGNLNRVYNFWFFVLHVAFLVLPSENFVQVTIYFNTHLCVLFFQIYLFRVKFCEPLDFIMNSKNSNQNTIYTFNFVFKWTRFIRVTIFFQIFIILKICWSSKKQILGHYIFYFSHCKILGPERYTHHKNNIKLTRIIIAKRQGC